MLEHLIFDQEEEVIRLGKINLKRLSKKVVILFFKSSSICQKIVEEIEKCYVTGVLNARKYGFSPISKMPYLFSSNFFSSQRNEFRMRLI